MQKFANKAKLSGGRKSAKKKLRKSLRRNRRITKTFGAGLGLDPPPMVGRINPMSLSRKLSGGRKSAKKKLRKSLRKIRKSRPFSRKRWLRDLAKTTTHPYYKMIDAAKAWHVAHVGSVLSWEDEAHIRNAWPGMRGRYTLKDAKAIVDLDEIGFSSNQEALFKLGMTDHKDREKPEEFVNYKFYGEENGSYIFAMPVPVGFTPSTAHTCAEELRKYLATRFGLDITTVDILYYNIQTFDTAMFGDNAMTSIDGTMRGLPFSRLSNDEELYEAGDYVVPLPVRPGTDKTTSGFEYADKLQRLAFIS